MLSALSIYLCVYDEIIYNKINLIIPKLTSSFNCDIICTIFRIQVPEHSSLRTQNIRNNNYIL